MQSIPLQLQTEFETLLRIRSVPTRLHLLHRKWLRYYLDFLPNLVFQKLKEKVRIIFYGNPSIGNHCL
jgi:hypothetical protein